mmetsp:Transcript_1348/g.2795  ORF Transcript_1348/g.2795 Transcript_1348/m.2795 type:complete len:281 (-) Transcript_1348:506-1348(-)
MISITPKNLLSLLLWNSYFIGRGASCGVPEELIRQRRRELQQLSLLNELGDETVAIPTDVPSSTTTSAAFNPQLLFDGLLLNDLGEPLNNAQVQFWHADHNGNYFHPGDDLDGHELQEDFSYFGTATTDANGSFNFRTYRPGIYQSRPITHIHFKVFVDGTEKLTSQFYFDDENVGRWYDEMLILDLQDGVDEDGSQIKITQKEVVVNMDLGGFVKQTPRQQEGPYYPLVDFFEIGSNMTKGLDEDFATTAIFSSGGFSLPRQLLVLTYSFCISAFLLLV